jgi:hypothetical protein
MTSTSTQSTPPRTRTRTVAGHRSSAAAPAAPKRARGVAATFRTYSISVTLHLLLLQHRTSYHASWIVYQHRCTVPSPEFGATIAALPSALPIRTPQVKFCWRRSLLVATMPSLVPLDGTLGAVLVGVVVSSMYASLSTSTRLASNPFTPRIYGITCLQVYIYFLEYAASDRKLLPAFVGSLWYVTPELCYSLSVFILLEGSGHPPSGIGMPLHLLLCCLQLRRLWRPSKGRVLNAHIFKP